MNWSSTRPDPLKEGKLLMSDIDDADDWASKFVQRLAKNHQAKNEADALLMRKQAMIHAEAPYLWDRLRSAINERVGKTNALTKTEYFRASAQVQGSIEHRVQSPAGHLSLTFLSTVPIIQYTFMRAPQDARQDDKPETGELRFCVFYENVWLMDANRERMSAAQAAGHLLDLHAEK